MQKSFCNSRFQISECFSGIYVRTLSWPNYNSESSTLQSCFCVFGSALGSSSAEKPQRTIISNIIFFSSQWVIHLARNALVILWCSYSIFFLFVLFFQKKKSKVITCGLKEFYRGLFSLWNIIPDRLRFSDTCLGTSELGCNVRHSECNLHHWPFFLIFLFFFFYFCTYNPMRSIPPGWSRWSHFLLQLSVCHMHAALLCLCNEVLAQMRCLYLIHNCKLSSNSTVWIFILVKI